MSYDIKGNPVIYGVRYNKRRDAYLVYGKSHSNQGRLGMFQDYEKAVQTRHNWEMENFGEIRSKFVPHESFLKSPFPEGWMKDFDFGRSLGLK